MWMGVFILDDLIHHEISLNLVEYCPRKKFHGHSPTSRRLTADRKYTTKGPTTSRKPGKEIEKNFQPWKKCGIFCLKILGKCKESWKNSIFQP